MLKGLGFGAAGGLMSFSGAGQVFGNSNTNDPKEEKTGQVLVNTGPMKCAHQELFNIQASLYSTRATSRKTPLPSEQAVMKVSTRATNV